MKKEIKIKTIMEKKHGHRILLSVNSMQLWYMMLGLERILLKNSLEKQANKLGEELHKIGKREYGWD